MYIAVAIEAASEALECTWAACSASAEVETALPAVKYIGCAPRETVVAVAEAGHAVQYTGSASFEPVLVAAETEPAVVDAAQVSVASVVVQAAELESASAAVAPG